MGPPASNSRKHTGQLSFASPSSGALRADLSLSVAERFRLEDRAISDDMDRSCYFESATRQAAEVGAVFASSAIASEIALLAERVSLGRAASRAP